MIDLLPSGEQQQIIDSVAEFFGGTPAGASHAHRDMAALGWFGLGIAEAQGGSGYCLTEEALIAREFGRALASPALCAAMLGVHVALRAGKESLARTILEGDTAVGILSRARGRSAGGAAKWIVYEGQGAKLMLYWDETGMGLYERTASDASAPRASLDETLACQPAPAPEGSAVAWVPSAQSNLPHRAALLIGAQLVGVAEGARDLAVEYAKLRRQFDQPVGAFQAIKHACADMAMQCEIAYAQTYFAVLAVNGDSPDAGFQCAAAALVAADAAHSNGRAGIQIHGGIGFTADCRAHRFLKRAHVLSSLLPPAARSRATCLSENPIYD